MTAKQNGLLIFLLFAGGIAGIFGGWAITEGRFIGWSDKAFNHVYALGVGLIIAGVIAVVIGFGKAVQLSGKKK